MDATLRKPRNSRADYQRRIERGLARGLTKSQARGHPAVGQAYIRAAPPRASFDPRLEAALKRIRAKGVPLTAAAGEARVGRERLSRYIKSIAGARREGRSWRFNDQRVRRLAIIEAGAERPTVMRVRGFQEAHTAGKHAHEAGEILKEPELYPEFIRHWEGARIEDVHGEWHELSTDINQIYEAVLGHDYSFERFYRIET